MSDQQKQITKAQSHALSQQQTKWQTNLVGFTRNETEKRFLSSLNDKTIEHYKTKEDYTRLIQVVTKWRIMLGLSKDMSEEELKINVQFIKNSYGKLTAKEIELAIDLSLQGYLGVDAQPYGNFSPLYISKILNAFVDKHNEQINALLQRKRQAEIDAKRNEVDRRTPMEIADSVKNFITDWGKRVRENDRYYGDYNHSVWNFLNAGGFIEPDDDTLKAAKEFADAEHRKTEELESRNVFMKAMRGFQKEQEVKKRKEMYGRFYVMRAFFRSIDDVDKFMAQFETKLFLTK
jgi:hypothetical protein